MKNISVILDASGISIDNVFQINMYVSIMYNYDRVNEIFAGYMSESYLARAAVKVSRFPLELSVEIEATMV